MSADTKDWYVKHSDSITSLKMEDKNMKLQ